MPIPKDIRAYNAAQSAGDKRICDEDTDLGLKYTLAQLAPEVLR